MHGRGEFVNNERGPVAVAVVVRTKNRPVFLARALANIFDQTWQDLHVVVVNDGGDKEPVDAVVQALDKRNRSRLTVLHHDTNQGMEAASNAGVGASDSTYLAIHDDDDLWAPEFLARTVGYLDDTSHRSDGGVMVRTELRFETVRDGRVDLDRLEPFWPDMRSITLADMLATNRAVPISFLYRRGMHQSIGLHNEELPVVGDWDFHLRFLLHSTIGFIDEPLAQWSQRPKNDGELGNSVFEQLDDHDRYDAMLRDAYLRQDLNRNGLGTMLVLSARLLRQEQQLEAQQRQLDQVAGRMGELADRMDDLLRSVTGLHELVYRRTSVSSAIKRPREVLRRAAGLFAGRSQRQQRKL
jgi:glycosyltransferase involved in cell wall biosynthesis